MATHRLNLYPSSQRLLLALFLLPALFSCQEYAATDTAVVADIDFKGRVIKVMDGDSLRVRQSGGDVVEMRMHGIDAPEWKQPHGEAAKKALKHLVEGRKVSVKVIARDSYDRLVSVVYRENRNVNVEMVAGGHAWWYQRYAGDNRALKQAQASAREARRGLWKGHKPVPPWKWRQQRR